MSKPARPFIGVAIITVAIALSACGPQPTPAPTAPPVAPTTPANDDLARVRASGKLRVGTSGDYPPFAFYNMSNYQLDGLDIALMREIGRRLGLQVEFSDFAFEGVLDAMRLGQVDAVAAAVSVTDARRQIVDFTNYYYISQDGMIALSDSPIVAIRSVEDIVGKRIGAQRGSVYETWLRQRLVDTGLSSPNELLLYARLDDAVRDLASRRIDLLVADLSPMQSIVNASRGQYKLVGQRLNVQQLAVATRKGSTLRGALDQALTQMQADGTLTRLLTQYLGVPPEQITPIPTATPGPPPIIIVTEPAPACIDGMAFIADLTYDDQNMANPPVLQPGQPFRKGWRVRNSGTCTWTTAYTFSYDGGNSPLAQMGGQMQVIAQPVVSGQTVDFYVDLVAPTMPGTYQGFWRMRNDRGVGFGTRVYVGIRVPQPVIPTQTPIPGVAFSASPTQISPGQPVVFTWNAQSAQAAYFYPQGQLWSQYPVPTVGQQTVYPRVTTTYELRIVRFDGAIEIRQIVIQVNQQPGAPVIQEFTTIPQNQVTLGQAVTLRWSVQGQVNRVRLLRNNQVILDNAPVVGTIQDYPQVAGQNTYTLEAYGAGVTRASRIVNVISSGLPGPTINAFSVTPESIPVGACVTIRWDVSGSATSIRITRNGQPVVVSGGPTGALQDCLTQRGFYGYRLEVLGPTGQLLVRERAVTVYR
ncbi:MAG: transporter substrate-binding domain-containing protein [Anaerolineae bacterium]|nr:transporter substrate-binding domain-containing protein [Candidatus Roseilinea sp.]MDW8450962.1 transporter substrate-binding domain-containing protein [Anaerolineae bacterium]